MKQKVELIYQLAFMFQIPYEIILLQIADIIYEKNKGSEVKKRILKKDKNIIYVDFSKDRKSVV